MWNILQCAVQGRSHIKSDTPCQDKTYSSVANDTHVIALADGAGSARLSHYGAETVTKYICSELTEKFDVYYSDNDGVAVKQQLMAGVLNSLQKQAEELKCNIEDLASTLLFVAVKNKQFILAHIGDGVIGYLKNEELKIASYPENGEFANTTIFTTSKDALMTMKLIKGSLENIQGFVLMSDGTEASLYNKKERKLAFAIKKIMQMSIILTHNNVQEQLIQSFRNIITKATTDDCSIAMLVKIGEGFRGYTQLTNAEKCKILDISPVSTKKQIQRYDVILLYLLKGKSLSQVARKIHLKNKYAKKYIDKLCSLNLIERKGVCYHTILIMNKANKEYNEHNYQSNNNGNL